TRRLHLSQVEAAVRYGEFGKLKDVAVRGPCETLGVAARKVLRSVKATQEPGTTRAYENVIRALERRIGKGVLCDAVSVEDAMAFLHGPQASGRPWGARTQTQARQVYRRVWKAAKARTDPWAEVAVPRSRKVRVTFLKPAEWRALVERHRGLP